MNELQDLYERLKGKANEGQDSPRSPVVLVLDNETDRSAIESHIRDEFGESLPLDTESAEDVFLEAHRLDSGELECRILIEYHNGQNGHSIYFQAQDVNKDEVQAVLGNLGPNDKLRVHLKGEDYKAVAAKLRGYIAVGHAEPEKPHELGKVYQETDESGVEWACTNVVLPNRCGLHMRPIHKFLKVSDDTRYSLTEIMVQKGTEVVDGKSILGLMTLGAGKGDTITLKASGQHAQEAVEKLYTKVKEFKPEE